MCIRDRIVRDVTDLASNNLSALTVSFVLRVGGIYVLLRDVYKRQPWNS